MTASHAPVLASPPRRVAVICTRRLGDVLLLTPLLRSIRRAWPQTRIDAIVSSSTAAALAGNPDVSNVVSVADRGTSSEKWKLLRAIFRRYDLAVAANFSDRTHILAFFAASRRVGILPPADESGRPWKRALSWRSVTQDWGRAHVVEQYLRLADVLEIPRVPTLVPPRMPLSGGITSGKYAVVHPSPMYAYKGWTTEGWRALIRRLLKEGLRVIVTGGPAEHERRFIAELLAPIADDHVSNLAGALKFPQLTPLIEGARVFIGPDTSVTHLAAATGTPTIALYGATSLITWGPWPAQGCGDEPTPWRQTAPWQQRGNVWLIQGLAPCAPCLQEGCDRHRDSRAACLDELPVARVWAAVSDALMTRR